MLPNSIKKKSNEPYSGSLWESGQFSVGRVSPHLPKKISTFVSPEHWDYLIDTQDLLESDREYLIANNIDAEEELKRIDDFYSLGLINSQQRSILLGLVIAPISQIAPDPERLRKGLSGITKLGRLTLENAVVRLANEVGMDRLTFGTVDFPPLPKKALESLLAEDYRLLEKEFRRRLITHLEEKSNQKHELIMTTEIQEKRFWRYGYPYLHWHFVFVSKRYKGSVNGFNPYWLDTVEIDEIWGKCVKDWLHNRLSFMGIIYDDYEIDYLDFGKACTLVKCHGMTAEYLGKYISKGCNCVQDCIVRGFEKVIPYHWWYVSPPLKRRVIARKIQLPSIICEEIFATPDLLLDKGYLKSFYIAEVEWNDTKYQVGVTGRMTNEGIAYVRMLPYGKNYSILFDE